MIERPGLAEAIRRAAFQGYLESADDLTPRTIEEFRSLRNRALEAAEANLRRRGRDLYPGCNSRPWH